MLADADEILLAEIAERRADPDLASREDILSLLVAARFEDGSGMADARATRSADDPADGRPRDDRHGARLGVRPAVSRPGQARAPAGGGRRRAATTTSTRSSRRRCASARWCRSSVASFESASRARRLRAARRARWSCRRSTSTTPAPTSTRTRTRSGRSASSTAGPETYSWIPFGGGTRRCIGARVRPVRDAGRSRDDPPTRGPAPRPPIGPSGWCDETSPCRRVGELRRCWSSAAPSRRSASRRSNTSGRWAR